MENSERCNVLVLVEAKGTVVAALVENDLGRVKSKYPYSWVEILGHLSGYELRC